MSERQSALAVRVRLPRDLERFRAAHVPNAPLGVPAHVTLVYPFVPAEALDRSVRATLASCIGRHRRFAFSCSGVRVWPDVLYLPVDPTGPFEALVASPGEAFPDHPPYGGEFSYVPHVTIAEGSGDALGRLEPPIRKFNVQVDHVLLIAEGLDGRWRTRWRFALRADDGALA